MSLRLDPLRQAVAEHGCVARVLVASVRGSAPREPGASMLVWPGGQSGTIGGGALEWRATQDALSWLTEPWSADLGPQAAPKARPGPTEGRTSSMSGLRAGAPPARICYQPLGPALGQCCGGAVTLVTELFTSAVVSRLGADPYFTRPIARDALPGPPPELLRLLAQSPQGAGPLAPRLTKGWLSEIITPPGQPLWIHGAGHIGQALVNILAPLEDFAITWVDTRTARFPDAIPKGISPLPTSAHAHVIQHAPQNAHHLVLTHSHNLDLELCHQILRHGFGSAGLIGSATKWARFHSRLRALGHVDSQIDRITCPIGNTLLGRSPQAIAIGVATALLEGRQMTQAAKDAPG